MANEFPPIWFDTFLSPTNTPPVDAELAFVQAHFPLPRYRRLLDVPCGIGRHAGPLAELGYDVLGLDRSQAALAVARQRCPAVAFREHDMFDLSALGERFDGLLCLWQSFGYGDSGQNRELLADMRETLRPGGRMLLDIYNAEAVALLPPVSVDERAGRTVRTRRIRSERRLRVELEYSDSGQKDVHEWEIYSREEIEELAHEVGFEVGLLCAWFDPAIPPGREHLRMQALLERGA